MLVVEVINDSVPNPTGYITILYRLYIFENISFCFVLVLVFDDSFQKRHYRCFNLYLCHPELFITVIDQNLLKELYIMLFASINFSAVN